VKPPLAVLVCAVGGQGGGVLADWIAEAAERAGHVAQSTSIPGVAQRTGATTYYIEIARERGSEAAFCLFPSAGRVDLVVALEPLEAARALQKAYVASDTTVVTATARVYAIGEKMVAGDGALPARAALDALRRAAKRVVVVQTRTDGNAALNARLLGAIVATGVLPISAEDCRRAIVAAGLAPERNLREFQRGLARVSDAADTLPKTRAAGLAPAPAAFRDDLGRLPAYVRPLVAHALARLVDYQDKAYARRYLERVRAVVRVDAERNGDPHAEEMLTGIVARRLAAWMMFEDAIRVAQIKTRRGRLTRVRAEIGAHDGEPVDLVDYLSPSWDDVRSILPAPVAAVFAPRDRVNAVRGSRPIRIRTSGILGFAALKALAALRPLRSASARFVAEQRGIDLWLAALMAAAPRDYRVACRIAKLASLARGYGAS